MDIRVTASEAKARLAELVNRVRYAGDRVWIERRGEVVAVLVSPDALKSPFGRPSQAVSEPKPTSREEIEALVEAGKLHPIMKVFGAWADDDSTKDVTEWIYANRRKSSRRRVAL